MKFTKLLLAMAVILTVWAVAFVKMPKTIAYPDGYRSWYHVKTLVLQPGHPLYESFGGIHHVYANKKALEGLKSGQYPNGAIFVFDLKEAITKDNALAEDPRKVLAVMEKDAKNFAKTSGWGFEGFAGGDPKNRIVTDTKGQCFSCYASKRARTMYLAR